MLCDDKPLVSAPPVPPAGAGAENGTRLGPATRKSPGWGGFLLASETLVLAFAAFLLTLIWSVVGYQIDHDRAAVLETAQVNTRNLARAYAEHIQGTLQLLDQALLHMKSEYENQSSDPWFLQRVINAVQVGARVVPMGIADKNGRIVVSNLASLPNTSVARPKPAAPSDVGDRDYFLGQMTGDPTRVDVSVPFLSHVTGKTAIALSRRLNNPDGSFAGVVFATFDPDYLTGFFSDLVIGRNSAFSILGRRDLIIRDMIRGSGRATDLVGKTVPKPQLVPALAHAPNGDYEAVSAVDGVARLFSYRSLPRYQLVVVASAAKPDVLANFDERKNAMLLAAVVVSLIFVGAAAFQLRRIAQARRYEIALNRSNEKLARAQRLATIGCFDHDVASNEAEWSDELYHILGLQRTDARPGRDTLVALIHPDDRERFERHRNTELQGQPTGPLEYRVIRPDGTQRIVRRETAVVRDKNTNALRRYGTLQDITALRLAEQRERELERKLLHSQKLEALGTLAGGIAHDLNNTLTPIMALSKLAVRRLGPNHELRHSLDMIFAASEQARDLVRRVLAFSRREKVEKIHVSPTASVNDALSLLRSTIPSSIQLAHRIDNVPPIFADPSQICQVVTNLVANGAQAIEPAPGFITVTLQQAGEEIRLSVTDTGAGMDEATRQRIFEPFFTTKEVGQGTGLGLSIIDGIVRNHGGRIEVASEPGKGTHFDVYFPIAAAAGNAGAESAAAA